MAVERDWDCYTIISPKNKIGLILYVSRAGRMGIHAATFLDFDGPWEHSEHVVRAFPSGKPKFFDTTGDGTTSYKDDPIDFDFRVREDGVRLLCSYRKFFMKKPLSCYLSLKGNLAKIPMSDDTMFKCFSASGKIEVYGKEYSLDGKEDFAMLYMGRDGTRTELGHRGCLGFGMVNSKPLGFFILNSVKKAGDNAFCYDGRIIKTGEVKFELPDDFETGKRRYHSRHAETDLIFTPVMEYSFANDLGFLASDRHTIRGTVSGRFLDDSGEEVKLENVFCLTEHVRKKALSR